MSSGVQKNIRIPEELAAWIESLPPKYGHNFSQKVRYLLELAKERQERIDWIVAENEPEYGKPHREIG